MLKKSFITVLFLAVCVFAAVGVAQAVQVGGMRSGSPSTAALPVALNVHVNPAGLGDALIYGYYNARGAASMIRVVNTSETTGIGAKVRFREGKNSNELLDFYICLSAGDQWTAWVVGDTSTTAPAVLYWYDNDTPTYPDPQANNSATDNQLATQSLKYGSTGAASSVTADGTKEGYLEIIPNVAWSDTPGSGKTVSTPNDCGYAVLNSSEAPSPTSSGLTAAWKTALSDAPNTLFGSMTIFKTTSGPGTYAYNATALADFMAFPTSGSLGVDSIPTLSNSQDTLTGVNYALTRAVQYATYDIESDLTGSTTIINTFPTKRRNIVDSGSTTSAAGTGLIGGSINGPFNDAAYIDSTGAISGTTTTGRCETVSILIWDDEENTPGSTAGFSPSTPTVKSKCDEVSLLVVGTSASSNLNSGLVAFNIDASSFKIGWVKETFSTGGTFAATSRATRYPGGGGPGSMVSWGLPVIGYELQNISGTTYSNMLPLRYSTIITIN